MLVLDFLGDGGRWLPAPADRGGDPRAAPETDWWLQADLGRSAPDSGFGAAVGGPLP